MKGVALPDCTVLGETNVFGGGAWCLRTTGVEKEQLRCFFPKVSSQWAPLELQS